MIRLALGVICLVSLTACVTADGPLDRPDRPDANRPDGDGDGNNDDPDDPDNQNADADNDGLTNSEEQSHGTDPNNPLSRPAPENDVFRKIGSKIHWHGENGTWKFNGSAYNHKFHDFTIFWGIARSLKLEVPIYVYLLLQDPGSRLDTPNGAFKIWPNAYH